MGKHTKKIFSFFLCNMLLSNLYALDIGKMASDAVSKEIGGKLDFNKIASGAGLDLSKMGLDGLNLGDILNLDLGSLSAMLSVKCNYSLKVPKIPSSFCRFNISGGTANFGAFNFSKSLNLGKCKISANASSSGLSAGFNSMAADYCKEMNDAVASWMPIEISTVNQTEEIVYDVSSPVSNITISSKYLKPKKIKGTNEKYKFLSGSQVYSPDGVLGFDRFYTNDKSFPKNLVDAYNNDDYTVYRAYERFAKTFPPSSRKGWSPNDKVYIDFTKLKVEASSYLEWKNDLVLNVKRIVGSYATPYITESKIKEELDRIKKKVGGLKGDTSAKLKASYLQNKTKILKELFDMNIKQEKKNGKMVDKATYSELAKAMRDLKNYERLKFADSEELYKTTHKYIVNPSGLKVLTKNTEDQIQYMDEMTRQQKQEARRRAENERMIKIKQETLELLAQKVFVSNLEYEPSIAQKEIDEILGQ